MNQSILEAAREILLGEAKVIKRKPIQNLKELIKAGDKVKLSTSYLTGGGSQIEYKNRNLKVVKVNRETFDAEDENGNILRVSRYENWAIDDDSKAKSIQTGDRIVYTYYYDSPRDGQMHSGTKDLVVVKIEKGTIYAKGGDDENVFPIDINSKNWRKK
jgi:hypothetical protein